MRERNEYRNIHNDSVFIDFVQMNSAVRAVKQFSHISNCLESIELLNFCLFLIESVNSIKVLVIRQ